MAALDTGLFAIGEKVLVPFTDKNYEAKILKAEYRCEQGACSQAMLHPAESQLAREDGLWYYFVHYNGWNKKYDTWVEDVGLIKMPAGGELAASMAGVGVVPIASQGQQPKTKRVTMKDKFLKRPSGAGLNHSEGAMVRLDLDMPPVLKKALLDDYDAIVEEGRLQPLPRSPSVLDLLKRYSADAQEHRGSCESEEELSLGLKSYFDKALQVALLYRGEREQAIKVLSDGRVASCIYGAEHLLRLFVKLPELMSLAAATEQQALHVAIMVQDLMMWMVSHAASLFISRDDYVVPAPNGAGVNAVKAEETPATAPTASTVAEAAALPVAAAAQAEASGASVPMAVEGLSTTVAEAEVKAEALVAADEAPQIVAAPAVAALEPAPEVDGPKAMEVEGEV